MFSCEGAVVVVNGTLELSGASRFSRASVLASHASTLRLMGRCVRVCPMQGRAVRL
jgi:hypothetical protein